MDDPAAARRALLDALAADPGLLLAAAELTASVVPAPAGAPDPGPAATAQFVNAFEAVLVEALEDRGREQRTLIFETALPAMVAAGQSALLLLQGHVAFFLLFVPRLLDAVAAQQRDAAGIWLAGFYGEYAREVAERAQALEAGT